jgi:hypothetical protein
MKRIPLLIAGGVSLAFALACSGTVEPTDVMPEDPAEEAPAEVEEPAEEEEAEEGGEEEAEEGEIQVVRRFQSPSVPPRPKDACSRKPRLSTSSRTTCAHRHMPSMPAERADSL